jgi:predicted DNA-binding transcriptional regulator AlpA
MIDVQELAREIAARMAPDSLLDASDVAALLKVSPRYVIEQFALSPGFPKAVRLTGPDGRKGQPRWKRIEIMRWVESHKDGATKRGGRPRKEPGC